MGDEKVPLLDPKTEDDDRGVSNGYGNNNHDEVCVTIGDFCWKSDGDEGFEREELEGDGDGDGQMQKAVDLFFENVPEFGKLPSIDPFRNRTPTISGLYANLKSVVLLPLLILRLLLVGVILVVGFIATKLALAGWEKDQQVLPRWRRRLMIVTRLCGRGVLFCFGFQWIRRIGRPARKEVAPIVVSNHMSFIDPIFYFYELFPSIVSSKSHDSLFLAGTIIRSMQVIPVDKASAESRKYATVEIKRRAASMEFPSVLLFPEGTTTNGRSLISFKLGAFAPGFPIQPVVIRYPFIHFDISWGDISLSNVMFRMLTQFNNFMEVEYLPVVYPTEREVQNPAEFAERVRYEMACALCVPATEYTYGDLMLSVNAQRLCLRSPASYMVEMGKIEKVLGLRAGDVKILLEKFAAMNPSYSGTVSMNQFLEWHHLPRCWMSKKIFDLCNKSEQGFSFREEQYKTGEEIFDLCDKSEQGFSFREFVAASGSISKGKDFLSQMKAAYTACNLQADGCITLVELEKTLKLSMPSISSGKVKMWFKKLDLHGDGVISWEEFQVFIEANPELLPIFMVGTFASDLS